ncbi:RNA-guided endonuclease TnpB family protein [Enterococcus gilvus]|uniref:RNA-guided endonuclease TnpB family protein n=1 Tax=Enterococcus gilvus TaxID=160453 RepID=UPI0028D13DD9|nr:RNA-guided endonuclease TnpB family protein [Enterococcus gilvus]
MEKYKISVVIPTYNREQLLIETLRSLKNQSLSKENFEVIVVDDGSDATPIKIIDDFSSELNIKLFVQENKGFRAGTARNKEVENSEGKIIVFVDAGVILTYETLEEHWKKHEQSNLPTAFLGYMFGFDELNQNKEKIESLNINGQNVNNKLKELDKKSLGDRRESLFSLNGDNLSEWENPWLIFWTGHLSLPKKEFLFLGGFDETFNGWGYEDIDLGLNWYCYGFKIQFSRTLVAVHLPHPKVKQTIPEKERKSYSNIRKQKLFEKYGMKNIRIWMEEDTKKVEYLSRKRGMDQGEISTSSPKKDSLRNKIGIIRLEKLANIRKQTRKSREKNHSLSNWSFYRLASFIEYKANLVGIKVEYVNPAYTSQRCPNCGHQHHAKDRRYSCSDCGYIGHRYIVSAKNIIYAPVLDGKSQVA